MTENKSADHGLAKKIARLAHLTTQPAEEKELVAAFATTIAVMDQYAKDNGYIIDINESQGAGASSALTRPARRHHEI